jgi:PAS domain S-box-containing protein
MTGAAGHDFEELPLQVWTSRPDGQLDYVNGHTAAYFGLSPERLLEDGWKDVCHSLDLITASQRWLHCLATGEDYEVRFRLLRGSDRVYRWHVARATAVRNEAGEITHWVGSNTDIDELVREQERELAAALRLARS